MSSILNLIPHYGYILIYGLLTIELMGVPFLPGELLILYCGFLVYQGQLNFILVILSAVLGVLSGMSLSYFIGNKLGAPFFHKYGGKLHFGREKQEKIGRILNKYGAGLIFFICFIPGVKHVIGYVSGTSEMRYKKYAISAGIGAAVWATIFLSVGDALGDKWKFFEADLHKYLILGGILLIVVIGLFYIIKIYKYKILDLLVEGVYYLVKLFKSMGKVRFLVIGVAIIMVIFIDILANIISGVISNEFIVFNEITYYVIQKIFSSLPIFTEIFKGINILTSKGMYIVIPIILIIVAFEKSKYKKAEIKYILITILGGFIIDKVFDLIIKITSNYFPIVSSLLDDRTFGAIVIYGFAAYILFIHTENWKIRRGLIYVFLIIGVVTGLSSLYFMNNLSSVLLGYSLGVVWVAINVILLEISKVNIEEK